MINEMNEDLVQDALQHVSGWDISDEEFAYQVNQIAKLMAGLYIDNDDPFVAISVASHQHG